MAPLWIGLFVLVVGLVMLDLWLLRPLRARVGPTRSVAYGAGYLLLAMAFNVFVFFCYENHWFGAGTEAGYAMAVEGAPQPTHVIDGPDATLQYLASFVLETVLGVDSVLVVAAVFAHMQVRGRHQHRLLMWGLPLAVVVRMAMILGFGEMIHEFAWFRFVLSLLLLLAAVRMVIVRRENLDPERNFAYRLLRKLVPMSGRRGSSLLTQVKGRPALSPLIVPLLLIETADAFLAFDSIPASYAVTREPFLIFCATCFALLFLRSIMPALMTMLSRIRYFKLGLAMILIYTAIIIARRTEVVQKVLASAELHPVDMTILAKLGFIGAAIIVGLLAAAMLGGAASKLTAVPTVSPLGEDADKIARHALNNARKVGVGLIGVTGLGLGAFMAVGPGPGIPVMLGALLLLATEFAIARRFLNKYRPRAEAATLEAAAHARKRLTPLAMAGVIVATIAVGVLVRLHGHTLVNVISTAVIDRELLATRIPIGLVLSALIPIIAGQVMLAYLAYVHRPAGRHGSSSDSVNREVEP